MTRGNIHPGRSRAARARGQDFFNNSPRKRVEAQRFNIGSERQRRRRDIFMRRKLNYLRHLSRFFPPPRYTTTYPSIYTRPPATLSPTLSHHSVEIRYLSGAESFSRASSKASLSVLRLYVYTHTHTYVHIPLLRLIRLIVLPQPQNIIKIF